MAVQTKRGSPLPPARTNGRPSMYTSETAPQLPEPLTTPVLVVGLPLVLLPCTPGIRNAKSVARRWSGLPYAPISMGSAEYISCSIVAPSVALDVSSCGGADVTVTVSVDEPTIITGL